MSKLVERLERMSEGGGQALGFGAAVNRVKTLPMLLIATLSEGDARAAAAAAAAGVDAVIVSGASPQRMEKVAAKLKKDMPDIPWGVSLDSVTRDDMERLAGIGCDFVVFSAAGSQASALNVEKIGKVLRINPSLDDNLLRGVNRLPVDAVLLHNTGGGEAALTVEQLMAYERLAAGSGKHLVAAMSSGLVDDMESLWGLGVQAIAVALGADDPEKALALAREAMEKLPAKRRRPGRSRMASLQLSGNAPDADSPEEDDEGDDEE